MLSFAKWRLPYREDKLFGCLFLAAFLIPLAFSVYNYESFEIFKLGLLLLCVGTGVIFAGLRYAKSGWRFRVSRPLFLALFLFWLWAGLSCFSAWDKNYAFFGFYPRFTNGFLFYSLWSALVVLLSLLNFEKIIFLIKALVVCSGLVSLWGLLQSIGIGIYLGLNSDFFNRGAPSFLGNPNFSTMFIVSLLPVTVVFLYAAKSLKGRVYYMLSVFLQLSALVILASRGALLALGLGLLVCIALSALRGKAGAKLLLLFVVIALVAFGLSRGFLNYARPGTVATTISLKDSNIQQRLEVWNLAVAGIEKRPWLGVGLGNFQLMFERERPYPLTVTTGFFDDPHNLFLLLAVSGGVPLLLFFLCVMLLPVLKGIGNIWKTKTTKPIGLIGGIAAGLFAGLFNPVPIACYMVLAFLISGLFTEELPAVYFPKYTWFKWPLIVFGALVLAYGAAFITAENLFFAGIRAYNNDQFSKALRYNSLAIDLNPVNRLYYVYRAGSAIRLNPNDQKISDYLNQVNRLNPNRSFSYVQLASLNYLRYYQGKDASFRDKIIDNMQTAIKLDPFSAGNYFSLSQYELIFGNGKEAKADFERGLALDPANSDAWIFSAKINQLLGDRQGLVHALEQAAKYQPDNTQLIRLLELAKTAKDLQALPFNVHFNVGRLD